MDSYVLVRVQESTLAQRKRVGLITQRSADRNLQVLLFLFASLQAFVCICATNFLSVVLKYTIFCVQVGMFFVFENTLNAIVLH